MVLLLQECCSSAFADHRANAGIPIGISKKLGDDAMRSRLFMPLEDQPGYEFALVEALKENAKAGDTVVVVGGGLGVTAVTAALAVTGTGSVKCFEGDLHGVKAVNRAAVANGVADHLSVVHAVVSEALGVYGNDVSTTIVRPAELPNCDVLELDCEGAEIGILRDMVIDPRVIAVETHGFMGAPTADVRGLLEARGYSVVDLGWAEPRVMSECVKNDIRVLVGIKPSVPSK